MSKKSTTKKQPQKISFFDALKNYWIRAFDVSGVSSRSEYWLAGLFYAVIFILINKILEKTIIATPIYAIVVSLFYLIQSIPQTTLVIRRWQDIGYSGFYAFVSSILARIYSFHVFPININTFIAITLLVFLFINFILFCFPSKLKNNKYRK